MKHIHYKNDFEFLLKIMGRDGAVRDIPQYRWSVVFSVDGVRYECSLRDGNAVVKGDTIVCRLQDHGFGCGELKAEFREWIPNKDWLDGVVDVSTPIDTGIELWEGKSDDSEETVSGSVVSAYFVYDAYLTAKANGYEGTSEEYYNALTGVVDIAEAEAGRVSSEKLREANEQQRVREFDAMKAKVDNVYTKAESDARFLRGGFEYCGLMEWDGKNEVKIYEMKFDSPKREVFIFGQCKWDNTNRGQFKIIITNEKYPSRPYGVSYFNSSSNAEECFHIHNVCGNYVCDINASNNHVVPNALKRCYMIDLLTDKRHEDVGLITNLKIEITTDLVRIDGVQKWYVFGK
nr:MAG TPA: hypothetical protein [Caudoviricetes sp.]